MHVKVKCSSCKQFRVSDTLHDEKMCSTFFFKKTLHIADAEQAISISEHFNQSRWRSFKTFRCSFEVKFKHGIFAVIQSMNLRKSALNGMCLDYVQVVISICPQ